MIIDDKKDEYRIGGGSSTNPNPKVYKSLKQAFRMRDMYFKGFSIYKYTKGEKIKSQMYVEVKV